MTIDESLLVQYALGLLDHAQATPVDKALKDSTELQSRLAEIQETLNILAFAEAPLAPDPSVRERVLASIEPKRRFEGFRDRFAALFDLGNDAAMGLLAKIDTAKAGEFASSLLPGVSVLKFSGGPRVASATCGLIRVTADTLFPRHRHHGVERVLVLQGRAREHSGRLLQPGDLLLSEAGSEHTFLTLGPEPFVFAVLLEKDNQWLLLKTLFDRVFRKRRFQKSS
ncbi:MAG: cupin domain-containing protein [Gammaproteobacteria bacterium]